MGLGALLLIGAMVSAVVWAGGLNRYETTGTVLETAPAYSCPGDPPLGEVFEGETVDVVGRRGNEWLVIHDERGPGDASFVDATVVRVDGDASQLTDFTCDPSGVPIAVEDTTTLPAAPESTAPAPPSSDVGVVETTIEGSTPTVAGAPGTSRPRSTTTTTRPATTTTTLPFPVAPPPSTTTTTRPPNTTTTTRPPTTTSTTTATTSTSPTTTIPTTTTTEATTTTTEATTTTTEATTTTTEATTTTT